MGKNDRNDGRRGGGGLGKERGRGRGGRGGGRGASAARRAFDALVGVAQVDRDSRFYFLIFSRDLF